jgi:hypothetical protein
MVAQFKVLFAYLTGCKQFQPSYSVVRSSFKLCILLKFIIERSLWLSIYLICLSIYLSIFLSVAVQPFVGLWLLFSFYSFTQSAGLLGWGISPSQGRYLQAQNKNTEDTRTDIHVSSGIRTRDPNVRTGEDSSCLRPRCHCDRLFVIVP